MRHEKALALLLLIITPTVFSADLKQAHVHIRLNPDGKIYYAENLTLTSEKKEVYLREIIDPDSQVSNLRVYEDEAILNPQVVQQDGGSHIRWWVSPGKHVYQLKYMLMESLSCFNDLCILKTNYPGSGQTGFFANIFLPDETPKNTTYLWLLPERNTTYHLVGGKIILSEKNLVKHENQLIVAVPRNLFHSKPEFAKIFHGQGRQSIKRYAAEYGRPSNINVWLDLVWPTLLLFWSSIILGVLSSSIINRSKPERHLIVKKFFQIFFVGSLLLVSCFLIYYLWNEKNTPPHTDFMVISLLLEASFFSLLVFYSKRKSAAKPYFKPGELPHRITPSAADSLISQNPPSPTLRGFYAEVLNLCMRNRVKLGLTSEKKVTVEVYNNSQKQLSESQSTLLASLAEKSCGKKLDLSKLPHQLDKQAYEDWFDKAAVEADLHGFFSKKIGLTLFVSGSIMLSLIVLPIHWGATFFTLLEALVLAVVFWDLLPNHSLKGIKYFRAYMGLKKIMSCEKTLQKIPADPEVWMKYLIHSVLLNTHDLVAEVFDEKIPQGLSGVPTRLVVGQMSLKQK